MLSKIRWRSGRRPASVNRTKRSAREERGATLVEYALLLGLIAVTAVGSLVLVGNAVSKTVTKTGDQILTLGNANDTISVVSGENQQIAVNHAYAAVAASVTNQNGAKVVNFALTFTIQSLTGGASATFAGPCSGTTCVVNTDNTGQAATPVFTANAKAGTFSITAGAAGVASTAVFPETNIPDVTNAVMTVTLPNSQTAQVGTQFGQFTVNLKDTSNNPIIGQDITLTAPPTSGPSGTFTGTGTGSGTNSYEGVTDNNGNITATFTAGTVAGQNYTVTVAAPNITVASQSFQFTNTPGPPFSVTIVAGNNQGVYANTAFPVAFEVLVADKYGNPVPTTTVTFTAPASTGPSGLFANNSITTTAVTDTNGDATASTFTSNAHTSATAYTVAATVTGVGTPANFSETNLNLLTSDVLHIEQGNNQSATVDTQYATSFRIELTTLFGAAVPNVQVTFTAATTPASGAFSTGCTGSTCQITTDANGYASATPFTANGTPGTFSVTVSAPNAVSVNFSETNLATGTDTMTITAGNNQTQGTTNAFPVDLQVQVLNASNVGVPGISVTFTAPTNASDPSGTFGGACGASHTCAVTSDANGYATAPTFTAGLAAGTYSVTASSPGIPTVSFTETNTAYAMATTAGDGQSVLAGKPFPVDFQVQITQLFGLFGVPNQAVTFTATAGSGTFSGGCTGTTCLETTDGGGYATAPTFTTSSTFSGTVTITVTSPNSNSVSLTETVGTEQLVIVQGNNQTATVGQPFAQNLGVKIVDTSNNLVTTSTNVVFTAPASGASGTFPNNTATETDNTTTGLVTANAFTANTTRGTYQVTVAATGVIGTSFTLTNANYNVTLVNGNNQSTAVGTAFPNQLEVHVDDPGNGPVANDAVTFTSPDTSHAEFSNNTNTMTVNTDGAGNAFATLTAGSTVATYTVNVTAAGSNAHPGFTETNTDYTVVALANTTPQQTQINTQFPNALAVQVLNGGTPVANDAVTFTAPATGASGTFGGFFCGGNPTCTVDTNALGDATAPAFTANGTGGAYSVTATAAGAPNPATFSLTNVVYTLTINGGNNQGAALNAAFATALSVKVVDQNNNPVPGVNVTFQAPSGNFGAASGTFGGTCNSRTCTVATAAGTGIATAPTFTANANGGQYTVTATLNGAIGSPQDFTETNGYVLAISAGNNQDVAVSSAFGTNLALTVTLGGVAVSGVNVTFTAPGSGASGTFGAPCNSRTCVVATGAAGVATAPTFTSNATPGQYSVTATVVGASNSPQTFTESNGYILTTKGGDNQSTGRGTQFPQPLSVLVALNGAPVSGVTVTFQAPAAGASGTFGGTCNSRTCAVTTGANGIATSPTFTANNTRGGYTVTASVVGAANSPDNFTEDNT